jgi:YfiH family protein
MEPFQYMDSVVPRFSLAPWEEEFPHLVAGFSARESGEDLNCRNYALHVGEEPEQVLENRRRLAREIGMPFEAWTCGEQVHGTDIRVVTREDRGRGSMSRESAFPATDGLLTKEPDVLLASFYADCVPLFFYSPDLDMVGIAHAGWRGTVGGIGPKMVKTLCDLGTRPERIRVAIGPSIGACCYEVDNRVMEPLTRALPDREALDRVAEERSDNKWKLDLKRANLELLKGAGVPEESILVSSWCTSCGDAHFYSYRRDRGKTGRMVAWIGKKQERGF